MILKVTLVFAIALVATWSLRRAAAATRHAMLASAQVAAMLVPLLTHALPPLPVAGFEASRLTGSQRSPVSVSDTASKPVSLEGWKPRHLWLLGFALVAAARLTSLARAAALVRRARVLRDGVRVSNEVDQPMTFFRTIVLPRDGVESPAILLHERAHVARRDTLIALIGDLACAVYWFHPLAWLVARRARLERERACDDAVLNGGIEADRYASAIVDVARLSRRALAMPMAAPSQLEQRVAAILDARVPRRASHAGLAAALMLVLAPAIAAIEPDIARPRFGEPDLANDSPPQSELLPSVLLSRVEAKGEDAQLIVLMLETAVQPPRDDIDYVAERARWALTRVRGGKLVEPLLESLDDSDWRVRAYAAWALGYSGDARATAPLIDMLDERAWRLRAMAASSLANLADPAAEQAMLRVVDDPAWQVRSQVARYLVARGTHRAMLRGLEHDRHMAVRSAAKGERR